MILGVIFILSSMCILGKAIHDLATKLLPEVVSSMAVCHIYHFKMNVPTLNIIDGEFDK